MEPTRELTSVDLRALVGELRSYEGAKVDKAYLYDDDLVRLKLRDFDRGRVEILIEVGERKRVHAADPQRVPDAPGRPPDFAKKLRNRVAGGELAGVEQYGFDRILEFHFERPDESTTVVAELFGDGNVAVLDENREVVACLETVRLKSRTVAPGSTYEFPEARVNPIALDYEAFEARMDESDTDLVRTLATQLDFGGLYAEELCTRAGVEKTRSIDDAGEFEYRALFEAIERLKGQLRAGKLDPRVYFEDGEDDPRGDDGTGHPDEDASTDDAETGDEDRGRRVDVTPFPLEERASLRAERFETFDAAVDDYFHHLELESESAESSGRDRPDFEAEIAKRERIIDQQEQAIADFERQAKREREKAELLYERYGLVDEVLSTVREAREQGTPWEEIRERFEEGRERGIEAAEAVADVDESEGTVTVTLDDHRITLDPAEGLEHNADRLYREAKRIEEKREGALEAIENTRQELEDLQERREAWEAGEAGTEEDREEDDEREEIDWLSEPSIPVRRNEQWYEQFRWFETSDGFLVIGGRDADDNEKLVKKYLDSYDRFFHAQAHGGPVTILKAAPPGESGRNVEIPERSEREAARFAVSYASVWKEGKFAGDAYAVDPDQVSKTPESGEFLEKGGFAIRGDREYFRDVEVGVAVGITCEPDTRVIGGPPDPIEDRAETSIRVEPGRYAQGDVGKRIYREFRERFADTSFVRKVASPDAIQEFLPPGTSRIAED